MSAITRIMLSLALSLVIGGAAAAPPDVAPPAVVVNDEALPDETLAAFEQQFGFRPRPGRYWYDRLTGAWGLQGQGTAGFMRAGLPLGGELRADASAGRTGVFINGRQLADSDVAGLLSMGVPVQYGRWSVDAWGNGGPEGYPPTFNIFQFARQARAAGGGGDSIYSTWGSGDSKTSTWIGSDGSLSYHGKIGDNDVSYSIGD